MDPDLVDRIYECSIVPELWPSVLDELGRLLEGAGGSLFITDPDVQYWTASPGTKERAEKIGYRPERWFWRGQFADRAFAARHAGFLTDLDLFTREELDLEPLFRDLYRPQGIGSAAVTAIQIPTGEYVSFVFARWATRGPFERAFVQKLDELRPHLARSALLSARLRLERARVAIETLAALGLPALVVTDKGSVLAVNSLIEPLTEYVEWRAFDHICFMDKAADRLLRSAIASTDLVSGASPRSFPVRSAHFGAATMVAHWVPIRLTARDIFSRGHALLVLTPAAPQPAPAVELVRSLFDLTPAEARVARSLASGHTPQEIASDNHVSLNTIRTQIRGVLEKTGCSRQADIVALLKSIPPIPFGNAI